MKPFSKLSGTMLILGALTSVAGHASNLLTAGDFEGTVSLSGYWAPATGIWGAESAAISSGANGVSPIDSQMLQINHAGGGTAAQVHQMVEGPFPAGSVVTFEVQFNSHHSAAVAGLVLENRSSLTSVVSRTANTFFSLDSDISTWQTFSVTHTLAANANFIAAEIILWHSSIPGPHGTPGGYADNAVLTVVLPKTDDEIAQEECEDALGGEVNEDGYCVVITTATGTYTEILRAAGKSGRAWTEMGEETTTTVKMYDRSGAGWEDEPFFEESETVREIQACFNPGGQNMGTKGQCGK